jgi:hypothetical protein
LSRMVDIMVDCLVVCILFILTYDHETGSNFAQDMMNNFVIIGTK